MCPRGWGWETTNTPALASGTPPVSPHSNSCPVREGVGNNRPACNDLRRDPPFPTARISAFGKHATPLHVPPSRLLVSHSCRIPLSRTMEPITLLLPLVPRLPNGRGAVAVPPISPRSDSDLLSTPVARPPVRSVSAREGNNQPTCTDLRRDPPFPTARISAFGKHATPLHVPPSRLLVSHSCRIPESEALYLLPASAESPYRKRCH